MGTDVTGNVLSKEPTDVQEFSKAAVGAGGKGSTALGRNPKARESNMNSAGEELCWGGLIGRSKGSGPSPKAGKET